MRLPCKVGDTVYWPGPWGKSIYQGEVFTVTVSKFGFQLGISQNKENHILAKLESGRVFLTREEAEAALKEREKS